MPDLTRRKDPHGPSRPVELGLTEAMTARWLYTSGTNMPLHT
jgi:hypothetical protein